MKPLGRTHDGHLYAESKGRIIEKQNTRAMIEEGLVQAEDDYHAHHDLYVDPTWDEDEP